MNLRRLNYILIPGSSEEWDRWGNSALGRWSRPWLAAPKALTREGMLVCVAVLVAGAAGVDVHYSNLFLVFSGLAGLLLAGAILRPFARLRGTRLVIDCPPRVTAGEPLNFTARIVNDGQRPIYALRVRGPFLPWDGQWLTDRPGVDFVDAGEEGAAVIQARFLRRGDRLVGRFWVASVRPLGLFMGNRVHSERVRITVVPRVCAVRGLPAPEAVAEPPECRDPTQLGGESYELLGVRPYRVGDRIRDLHARSWARTGQPMVREYRQATRRRAVVCLVGRSGASDDAFDAAAGVAASLVQWASRMEAIVDLVIVGEQAVVHRIGDRESTLDRALDALAAARPGDEPQAARALSRFAGRTGAMYLVCPLFEAPEQALAARIAAIAGCRTGVFAIRSGRRDTPAIPGVQWLDPKAVIDGALIEATLW